MRTMKRRTLFLAVALVVVAVVAATVAVVYVFTRPPPIPLTVSDGSTTGVLEANFMDYTWTNTSLLWYFNATTYANQSGGAASTLTLRLFAGAFYDPSPGIVVVDIEAAVYGEFASNLHLSGLTLTGNQTGRLAWGVGHPEASPYSYAGYTQPGPVNVTYQPQAFLGQISGPGSASLTPPLVNETGKGPYYEFVYPIQFMEQDPLGDNTFFGFRATVTGDFAPDVSVGILLHIVNQPA